MQIHRKRMWPLKAFCPPGSKSVPASCLLRDITFTLCSEKTRLAHLLAPPSVASAPGHLRSHPRLPAWASSGTLPLWAPQPGFALLRHQSPDVI